MQANESRKNIISGLTEIGNIDAICPSCNCKLDEKPERKKKCPQCGNFIYVRSRPLDRKRVLISDKQIEQLDYQWQIYNDQKEQENYEQDPEYIKVRDELRNKFNREPSFSDVRWALANLKGIEHAKNNQWGLYRDAKHEMAKILEREGRTKDLSPELAIKFPPFDQKHSFVAPGIINTIIDFSRKLNLDYSEVKSLFLDAGKSEYQKSLMPFDPNESLKKFLKHFNK